MPHSRLFTITSYWQHFLIIRTDMLFSSFNFSPSIPLSPLQSTLPLCKFFPKDQGALPPALSRKDNILPNLSRLSYLVRERMKPVPNTCGSSKKQDLWSAHPFLKTAMLCQSVRWDHSLSPGPGLGVRHIVLVARLHSRQLHNRGQSQWLILVLGLNNRMQCSKTPVRNY
jgi:hypothetical protein